jgi:tetratricopeptide (TPR) repeat protein
MEKIERLLQRARLAIAERDWEKAKQLYLLALGQKSDLPDIHYGLATVYFQLRELTSAAHHFREVARLDPLRAGAHVNLGAVLNLLDQVDEAITSLRRAIQLDPTRVEAYYNLGLVHRRKGQLDMAIQAYREALRLNPKMADANLNLANLFVEKAQYRQAIHHYEQALKLRPNWTKAEEGLAYAQEQEFGPQEQEDTAAVSPTSSGEVGSTEALDRIADPIAHANLLTSLHQTAKSAEEMENLYRHILEKEVEPAIKELSSALLASDSSRGKLDRGVEQFEGALSRMRQAQQALLSNLTKLREMSERFPNL